MSGAGAPHQDRASAGDPIADFCEKHPYPPPVEDLDGYRARWSDPAVRRAEHHLLFPDRAFTGELDALVAGCGTSQAAWHAIRWPAGRVVGIDVSATSIRQTAELKRRHDLGNLALHLVAIEDVARLDRQFDLDVLNRVSSFFRYLSRFDQVVFDLSVTQP
ncbi:MAG: class I SAM-dependent methyltransferase [Acidimicrobiia bacterium]|nr:class I SAM-dependent methyltransferase [Acidimicrobiia bacterium]